LVLAAVHQAGFSPAAPMRRFFLSRCGANAGLQRNIPFFATIRKLYTTIRHGLQQRSRAHPDSCQESAKTFL
jgi:hypothetical protein